MIFVVTVHYVYGLYDELYDDVDYDVDDDYE